MPLFGPPIPRTAFALSLTLALTPPLVAADPPVRVVLVGDSTVTDASGWGAGFARLVGPGVEVVNLAKSGRSSKSFRHEGHWQKVLDARPAWVLIQFGHNDQPGKGPARETDPKTTFRANLARYVDDARAAGATPVLITSVTRRIFDKDGKVRRTLTEYAEATAAIAKEKSVPLVDLHARSIAELEKIGPEAAKAYNPTTKDGKPDGTHLSPAGADATAKLVTAELKLVAPELAKRLK